MTDDPTTALFGIMLDIAAAFNEWYCMSVVYVGTFMVAVFSGAATELEYYTQ
jgi:hypothetical protein